MAWRGMTNGPPCHRFFHSTVMESRYRRKRKASGVMAVEPQHVPWWWQALALLALIAAGAGVLQEAPVHHRPSLVADSPTCVDINFGSAAELDSLPRIGPALAKAIMAARPFSKPEDIERVKGISPAMAGRLRPLIQAAHGRRAADRR